MARHVPFKSIHTHHAAAGREDGRRWTGRPAKRPPLPPPNTPPPPGHLDEFVHQGQLRVGRKAHSPPVLGLAFGLLTSGCGPDRGDPALAGPSRRQGDIRIDRFLLQRIHHARAQGMPSHMIFSMHEPFTNTRSGLQRGLQAPAAGPGSSCPPFRIPMRRGQK